MHAVPPMGPFNFFSMIWCMLCPPWDLWTSWREVQYVISWVGSMWTGKLFSTSNTVRSQFTIYLDLWLIWVPLSPLPHPPPAPPPAPCSFCAANIFAIGDCTNVPASRTAAACAAQAAVLRRNLLSLIKGAELTAKVCTSFPSLYSTFGFSPVSTIVRWLRFLSSHHWLW